MYICPNCNYTTEDASNYCPVCGSKVVEVQPQPVQPVQYEQPAQPQQVQYTQADPYAQQYNMYYQQTAVQPVSKGKIIAGMVLSIVGLFFAAMGLLYTFVGLVSAEIGLALGFAIAFGMFSVPLSIVGLVLSAGAQRQGSDSGMSKVGKILGLIGVIASGVMLLLGLMSLGFDGYGYSDYF